jgi:hypothetical protein
VSSVVVHSFREQRPGPIPNPIGDLPARDFLFFLREDTQQKLTTTTTTTTINIKILRELETD